MKVKGYQGRGVIAVVTVITLILVTGCASKVKIRASDAMFSNNPMNKIAVFAEGKVNWPRMGKGGSVLILPYCKKATENSLVATKQLLSKKGYEVVYAEPVSVGSNSKGWWLIEDPEAEGEESKLKHIPDRKPTFVYPKFQDDGAFSKSMLNIIEQLEWAVSKKHLNSFEPSKEDIEVIRQATNADTICLNRIYGVKYSARRKVGEFALGVLAAMFGVYGQSHSSDRVHSSFIFINAKTGEVLWQRVISTQENPLKSGEEFAENVLKFLPARNEPFDQKACAKGKDGFIYCNPSGKTDESMTPLVHALCYGQRDNAKLLIEKGADVNAKDKDGWTPLMFALRYEQPSNAKLLIEKGANVNAKDKDGWTSLMHALYAGQPDNAKLLIEKGADVNAKNKDPGWTPLMFALRYEQPSNAKLLIEKGTDVNAKNKDGWTPLMLALRYEQPSNAKLLIEKGADVNAKNKDGWTPLMFAEKYAQTEITEALIENGALK